MYLPWVLLFFAFCSVKYAQYVLCHGKCVQTVNTEIAFIGNNINLATVNWLLFFIWLQWNSEMQFWKKIRLGITYYIAILPYSFE